MFVVGTAGHVDHGKSSLVRAISGINPDRLREEQEREMTIDLGFAWVTLPSGREISIVDVPGHEDFIKNMLAGVGGIDLALLVVAADEAVMPQTREHLAILDLLQIPQGVIALTKADLVEDEDWLDLVAEEVREAVAHTILAQAPIVPVSVVTGRGLARLLEVIDDALEQAEERPDLGSPRLPIDRAFSISGFGTVVTGTLTGGRLNVGDSVEIVPGGRSARIRGLQSHKTKLTEALPGMRVAVNLVGVDVNDIARGEVLTAPGTLTPTRLVDVQMRVIPDGAWPIRNGMVVDFFSGAAGCEARVRLLEVEAIEPGETGWAQLLLVEPMALSRKDRFIVRMPSPSMTLGGGTVVEPHPVRRHRRFSDNVVERMEALSHGSDDVTLLTLLDERGPLSAAELVRISQMRPEASAEALDNLLAQGDALALGAMPDHPDYARWQGMLISRQAWDRTLAQAVELLGAFHRAQPLREGMSREELKSRLGMGQEWANHFFDRAQAADALQLGSDWVALAEHGVTLSAQDARSVDALMERFSAEPYAPPSYSEVETAVGSALAQYLIESGRLVRLNDAVVFESGVLDEMISRLRAELGTGSTFTVAQVRDLFGTSRKYVVAFLEELDRRRITRRIGDERILR